MKSRVLLAALTMTLGVTMLVHADGQLPKDVKPRGETTPPARLDEKEALADLATRQARMAALFGDFKAALLRMSVRLANSSKPEDKARATVLKTALDRTNTDNIEAGFDKLIATIQAIKPEGTDSAEIARAIKNNEDVTARIRALLVILQGDSSDELLKKQLAAARARLEEIKRLIREQRNARDRNELGRGTDEKRMKDQEKIKDDTDKLAKMDPQGNLPGKKEIDKAIDSQNKAIGNLGKGKPGDAAGDQGDAANYLDRARREIEDQVRQLHHEENERTLAALQARCERMLAMQIEVRDGTVALDRKIQTRPEAKPDNADRARANELQDRENDINKEARSAWRLVEEEGSAISFQVVFQQLVTDVGNVANHLGFADTGAVTVTIENDIIDTLKEMIDALKQARKANNGPPEPPPPDGPNGDGPRPKEKLVKEVQELKMIRNMQVRINKRTETYGKEYRGEQAPALEKAVTQQDREQAAMLNKELKALAESQDRIANITRNFVKEKNK